MRTQVTATYYFVSNLWRSFFGALTAVVLFALLAEKELLTVVPPVEFDWEPHVGPSYLAFASLGALHGLLSALIVHLMSLNARGLRYLGLLRPLGPRLATVGLGAW